jgi:hypothetical protein
MRAQLAHAAAVVFAAALCHVPPVLAQSDTTRAAAARSLFTDGVAHAQRAEYAAAADRFQRAYELMPTPSIAFNLASALVPLGRLVEASELLARVLRDDSIPQQLRDSAAQQRDRIEPRIARLELRLVGVATDVRVELDGIEHPSATIGVAVPIDPGEHEVRALRGAREVARARVQLDDGERRALTLELTPDAPPPVPDVPDAALQTSESDVRRGGGDEGWIALGVGLGVVAVGAVVVLVVLLATPGSPTPLGGNAVPGVLEW